jgi:hypothetical protein
MCTSFFFSPARFYASDLSVVLSSCFSRNSLGHFSLGKKALVNHHSWDRGEKAMSAE